MTREELSSFSCALHPSCVPAACVPLTLTNVCSQIDLSGVEECKKSTAPGATEFEIELVTDQRAFRLRAPNKPEMEHWMVKFNHFVG